MRISDWSSDVCSSDLRQEFILLSDTLGLSQLVVAQSHSRPENVSEQTVFGPFHVEGAPKRPSHGSDLAQGVPGEPLYVTAQVVADGHPVAGAEVDTWHADADGFYDVQDEPWSDDKAWLRAAFRTADRSEERRVGKEGVSPGRAGWETYH